MTWQYTANPPIHNETMKTVQPQPAMMPHPVAVTQSQVVVFPLRPDQTKVPCDVQCPKCNKVVRSKVTMVMGNCANICCCFICCLGGCCLGFIPWFCDYFKDAEHHCPVCKTFLGVSRKLKEAPFVKL